MKKLIALILLLGSCLFLVTGCFKRDNLEDIDIYTTAYPIEYITNYLYGTHSNVQSIYPDGTNIKTYKLTDKQITDYSKASLFIFNGLSNEKDYVVPMVNHNHNLKLIDTTLSMEYENEEEELWLDPSNFLMLTQNIRNGLKEYINNHYLKNEINEKYNDLKVQVSEIDAKLKLLAESSDNKTIVVSSDLYNFLSKYNFNVISLEENNNLTDKKIEEVKNLIYQGDIDYIFLKEDESPSKTIQEIQKETNVELVKLHNISTLTEEERKANKDYLSLMNENIDLLRNELYD